MRLGYHLKTERCVHRCRRIAQDAVSCRVAFRVPEVLRVAFRIQGCVFAGLRLGCQRCAVLRLGSRIAFRVPLRNPEMGAEM